MTFYNMSIQNVIFILKLIFYFLFLQQLIDAFILLFHFNVYRMISHTQSIYSSLAIINEISLVRRGYLLERERERERERDLPPILLRIARAQFIQKQPIAQLFSIYSLSNILHPDVVVPENHLLYLSGYSHTIL